MSGLESSRLLPSSPTNTSRTWLEGSILHEWYRGFAYVGRDFLGEFAYDPGAHPEMGWRRSGAAYYCAECGDIWARIVFINSRGEQQLIDVERVSCEKHPDPYNVPGSLLGGLRLWGLLDILPRKAVERELRIHLREVIS